MSPSPIQGIERKEFEITEADWTISSKLIRPATIRSLTVSYRDLKQSASHSSIVSCGVRAPVTNYLKMDSLLPVSGNP